MVQNLVSADRTSMPEPDADVIPFRALLHAAATDMRDASADLAERSERAALAAERRGDAIDALLAELGAVMAQNHRV